jgi:hypothetical protein
MANESSWYSWIDCTLVVVVEEEEERYPPNLPKLMNLASFHLA